MMPPRYLFVRCVCVYASESVCVCVCLVNTSEKKKREKERRRRENLGKYIFLITVSEVNAAYLGVPTAAAGRGGGEEEGGYLTGGETDCAQRDV